MTYEDASSEFTDLTNLIIKPEKNLTENLKKIITRKPHMNHIFKEYKIGQGKRQSKNKI